MGVRNYRPTSNGRRGAQVSDWAELTYRTKNQPVRALVEKIDKTGGRNHHGQVTARHMGGGATRLYRKIDFKRRHDDIPAKVVAIEYDPNRTCRIALIHYADGKRSYILAPRDLKVGDEVISGEKHEPKSGVCMPLKNIPTGIPIHNIELQPKKGGQLARAAGVSVQLMAKEGEYGTITLPSGEVRKVNLECRATIGELGNQDQNTIFLGKAGRHRWMGYRPYSRGSCRNPVDHPMGGGEGRRAGGRHPVGFNGVLSKGGITRKPKARSNPFIVRGRKKRRSQ